MGFVANFVRFSAVQKFWKSVNISQNFGQFKGWNFFLRHSVVSSLQSQFIPSGKIGRLIIVTSWRSFRDVKGSTNFYRMSVLSTYTWVTRISLYTVPTNLESPGIYLIKESRGILLMDRGKRCVLSELRDCCLFLLKKLKIHIECML